jgi:predicted phosphodiesterase
MKKYTLMSDLHMDMNSGSIPFDVLCDDIIIAGDTTNGLMGTKYLKKLQRKGKNVYAVDGNHEHYNNRSTKRTMADTTNRFKESFPSIHHLDDVSIICVNGWYQIADYAHWNGYMNDCYYMSSDLPQFAAYDVNNQGLDDYTFIADTMVANPDRKFIIVTHTSPCLETLDQNYVGDAGNQYYYNPLGYQIMEEFGSQILVWNHGHTHSYVDKMVCGVRVICNPRGYFGENPKWKPLTVHI